MASRIADSAKPKAFAAAVRAPRRVRIIGGRYQRMQLPVIDAQGLRPTGDRIRETLFNWLGQDLSGWRCADIFAGTGALGFEAASRGAARVTLVERHAPARRALHAARDRLQADMVDIIAGDALAWLARQPDATLDLLFIDPPFAQDWTQPALLAALRVVRPGGLIYLESPRPLTEAAADGKPARTAAERLPPGLARLKYLRAGAVHAHLLRRENG